MNKAFLILADGTVFEGFSIGAEGRTIGETVFTTGMTGYLETLTDPSYYGQIVTQTFPLIGNYGVIPEDFESKKSWVRGYIVRELCDQPSNFRNGGNLDSFLKAQGIVGICGIDTRALTKRLRESGVMNGMIVSEKDFLVKRDNFSTIRANKEFFGKNIVDAEILEEIKDYKIEDAVEKVQMGVLGGKQLDCVPLGEGVAEDGVVEPVNTMHSRSFETTPAGARGWLSPPRSPHIVLWDFGAKANIKRELEKRACRVTVVPCHSSAKEIISLEPDGLMLSNGPGDPAENVEIINEIKKICDYGKLPIFGICLGHQLLALARGCKTCKLKYGHRGGNHPVKDTQTGRVYITSQNHGYAVENTSIPDFAKMSFFNVNDGTVEGLSYTDIPAFSVQFHPEACGGPHDTNFLFDKFIKSVKKSN